MIPYSEMKRLITAALFEDDRFRQGMWKMNVTVELAFDEREYVYIKTLDALYENGIFNKSG